MNINWNIIYSQKEKKNYIYRETILEETSLSLATKISSDWASTTFELIL